MISTGIAIAYVLQTLVLAIILPILVHKYSVRGGTTEVGYSCIIEQAGYNKKFHHYLYFPFFIIRGIATAALLVFTYDYPKVAGALVGTL